MAPSVNVEQALEGETVGELKIMAATEAELKDAHDRLLADDTIQFDLPGYSQPEPPVWMKELADALSAIAPYLIYLFWGAVIIAAAVVAFLIFVEVKGIAWRLPWQRAAPLGETDEEWRPTTEAAQILLSEADDLAQRGEFDAAVHLLLRRSVADISLRLPDFVRPSLTSRDIAAATSMPHRARTAFARIAQIVESALFARVSVGAKGWQDARQAYEQFAFRDAWS